MDRKNTREDRIWRAQVIRRDSRCVICGSMESRNAHHLNSYSYFPNERYDVNNGVTLCGGGANGCHSIFHNSYKNSYREKCTLKDFVNFKELLSRIKNKTIIV